MNIVYVPLGEAKVGKSDCFSDLEISGATFTHLPNGGIPVGPFWCEPKISSANTHLLQVTSKTKKVRAQQTKPSRTCRFPSHRVQTIPPSNQFLLKVAASNDINPPPSHQTRYKKYGKKVLMQRRGFRAEAPLLSSSGSGTSRSGGRATRATENCSVATNYI